MLMKQDSEEEDGSIDLTNYYQSVTEMTCSDVFEEALINVNHVNHRTHCVVIGNIVNDQRW